MLILAVSFVLAFRSMGDYYERAANFSASYSLYLIGKPDQLNIEIIGRLHEAMLRQNLIISFERLFRGDKRALVVFGPVLVLQPFMETLGLSELEDYSRRIESGKTETIPFMSAWEVGVKGSAPPEIVINNLRSYIPQLEDNEEFWWQLVMQPAGKMGLMNFQAIIRAVLLVGNQSRAKILQKDLLEIGGEAGLTQLPQAYSTARLVKFYQDRALPQTSLTRFKEKGLSLALTPEEILSLVGILRPTAGG